MVFKLTSSDKEPMVDGPPVIYQPEPKQPRTKKYLIIGSFSVVVAALIMTAILVGVYIYTEAQKEIVKFTLKMDRGRSQDVTSDAGSNIVIYHVRDGKTNAWIVNDFNTDIKVTKIESGGYDDDSSCYITPLNRSTAMEPSKVTKPQGENQSFTEPSHHDSVIYQISGEPVADISFLNKAAKRMCRDVPTYWMYPTCYKSPSSKDDKFELIADRSPYYVLFRMNQSGLKIPCVNGCCKTVCACEVKYSWQVVADKIICYWITSPCCKGSKQCFYKSYCSPTKDLTCDSNCA